jgi:hypothetical protein
MGMYLTGGLWRIILGLFLMVTDYKKRKWNNLNNQATPLF